MKRCREHRFILPSNSGLFRFSSSKHKQKKKRKEVEEKYIWVTNHNRSIVLKQCFGAAVLKSTIWNLLAGDGKKKKQTTEYLDKQHLSLQYTPPPPPPKKKNILKVQ